MPTYLTPGIYLEERSSGTKPITAASTSIAAFVGIAVKGPVGQATLVSNFSEFVKRFGGPIQVVEGLREIYLYYAVRHFFALGGSRCYIVRVAGSTAAAATATLGSLTVSAISPGVWGESLDVRAEAASQYSHPLVQAVAVGDTRLRLPRNDDVRVGSLLWLVDEATGTVTEVNETTKVAKVRIHAIGATPPSSIAIQVGTTVFTPDLQLVTSATGTSTVNLPVGTAGTPGDVTLTSVKRADGRALRAGDTLNFALSDTFAVVTRVGAATVGGTPATEVEISPASPDIYTAATSRVYERSFNLTVLTQSGGRTDAVEVHRNLSLVPTDALNHVRVRLPAQEGASFYVRADGSSTAAVDHGQATLGGGNDGLPGTAAGSALDALFIGDPLLGTGLEALSGVTDASILCVAHASTAVTSAAIAFAERRRNLVFIADLPPAPATIANVANPSTALPSSSYTTTYFPWIQIEDPFTGRKMSVPPSGAMAGIFARSDARRGVHKAPAGTDVGLISVATGTPLILTKAQNDTLHGARVNAIRNLPEGIVAWGARTLSKDPEWSYLNVRRLFIFLEQSIEAGTQWVAFEPNDESLWAKLRRNISAFLRLQWREGKLVGATEEEAFYVKCDSETNPPETVDAGMVITEIGVAPSKPAEFVVFRIRQIAGGDVNS